MTERDLENFRKLAEILYPEQMEELRTRETLTQEGKVE